MIIEETAAMSESKRLAIRNSNFQYIVNALHPVGSLYISAESTSPSELFGGTWVQIKDTFLLACGDTYAAGATGGEARHTLTENELPKIEGEIWNYAVQDTSGVATRGKFSPVVSSENYISFGTNGQPISTYTDRVKLSFGGNQPHNNMPPYLAVYMWYRVA